MPLNYKLFSYQGVIVLKSSDRVAIQHLRSEISSLLKEYNNVNGMCLITENKKSKYITIFKSPFVYKKAKDTFLFQTHSCSFGFNISNLLLLKVIIAKLANYKNVVDSSIKASVLTSKFSESQDLPKVKFGTEDFKNLIHL
ncbi:MAG TPA: 30S ribosomal protein S10 [Chitinophagales bacterium]|nr:30S ribosomal protein S10 [Chitinophagales bacterium]